MRIQNEFVKYPRILPETSLFSECDDNVAFYLNAFFIGIKLVYLLRIQ